MHFKLPHKTTKFQAIQKVKQALIEATPQLKEHATITEELWKGDVLYFAANLQGKTITGTLEVTDSQFIVDAQLPLMWRLFEGRIEKMIAEQVKKLQ